MTINLLLIFIYLSSLFTPLPNSPLCSDSKDRASNRMIWDAMNGRKGVGYQMSGDYLVIYYQHVENAELNAMEAALERWGWTKTREYETGEEWKKPSGGFNPCPPPVSFVSWVTWPMMLIFLLLLLLGFAIAFASLRKVNLRHT